MSDLVNNMFPGVFPYPTMFDPSQWSNQFSNYGGAALPWPPSYSGTPTDALGRPIASYQPPAPQWVPPSSPAQDQGTTLTSGQFWIPWGQGGALAAPIMSSPGYPNGYGQSGEPSSSGRGPTTAYTPAPVAYVPPDPTSAPQQPGGWVQPPNWDAALSALSNPGRVTTPGAAIPQGQPAFQPQGGNVLQAFLAQRGQNPGSGPGAGFIGNLMGRQK